MNVSVLNGYGRGKKALIVGRGWSALETKCPEGCEIITVNSRLITGEYNVFYDAVYIPMVSKKSIQIYNDKIYAPRLPNWYSMQMTYKNSGVSAIIFAEKIMQYDIIYLTGFDMQNRDDGRTYYDSDEKYPMYGFSPIMEYFLKEWKSPPSNIINLNKDSALTVFKKIED